MFDKILVANRGEIACRIMRTAKRLGIGTVAVYSDADRNAPHVEMADEAVRIGPPAAAESYLKIDAILDACAKTRASAVHPGYGFLSERAAFPTALEAAGVVFIGPNPAAIDAMGDKIESKRRAKAAGVSTVPGGEGEVATADAAVAIAEEIGYPVMIKASAGGGGKGMRIAGSRGEVAEGFARARSEAQSSFGDPRVFVEKFIVDPRHIEIQVLGDKHGTVIHLLERECSIQRRNQKVIEEAPSPLLTETSRAKMGAQAVALAQAVGYDSAGTVEFVADQDANFYFLEMNTRLQVEHPVTELITGLDLVEEMIRVAAGEPLRHAQADIRASGWAIEARLYAEDPERGFLPSIGRLRRLRFPVERPNGATRANQGCAMRVDTGVVEGSEISRFYDPMIAKIVTHGPTRAAAIDTMADALQEVSIDGIRHNGLFLAAIMDRPRWREGRLSTGFIAEEFADGGAPVAAPVRRLMATVAFAFAVVEAERRHDFGPHPVSRQTTLAALFDDGTRLDGLVEGYREVAASADALNSELAFSAMRAEMDSRKGGRDRHVLLRVTFGADSVTLQGRFADGLFRGSLGAKGDAPVLVGCRRGPNGGVTLTHRGAAAVVRVMRPPVADLAALMPKVAAADSAKRVVSPMPGLVVSLAVKPGDKVEDGQTLAVIEAMKMENVLRAERSGTVKSVQVAAGQSVPVDTVILEFE